MDKGLDGDYVLLSAAVVIGLQSGGEELPVKAGAADCAVRSRWCG